MIFRVTSAETEPSSSAHRAPPAFTIAAAIGMLCGAYLTVGGCLSAPYLRYDDLILIARNHLMRAPVLEHFQRAYHSHYIPLTTLSEKLNFVLFGPDAAWSFRVGNAMELDLPDQGFDPLEPAQLAAHREELLRITRHLLSADEVTASNAQGARA